jgi:hypothetical protein
MAGPYAAEIGVLLSINLPHALTKEVLSFTSEWDGVDVRAPGYVEHFAKGITYYPESIEPYEYRTYDVLKEAIMSGHLALFEYVLERNCPTYMLLAAIEYYANDEGDIDIINALMDYAKLRELAEDVSIPLAVGTKADIA